MNDCAYIVILSMAGKAVIIGCALTYEDAHELRHTHAEHVLGIQHKASLEAMAYLSMYTVQAVPLFSNDNLSVWHGAIDDLDFDE